MTQPPDALAKRRPLVVWIAIAFLAILIIRAGIGHFEWTRRVVLAETPFTWQYLYPIAMILFEAIVLTLIVKGRPYGRWIAVTVFGIGTIWEV